MNNDSTLQWLVGFVRSQSAALVVDSRKVIPGCVFIALPPALPKHRLHETQGGEQYIQEVAQKGASYIVLETKFASQAARLRSDSVRLVLVEDTRDALGQLAAAYYGTDTACPQVYGITGTNGKTTETYLLEHLFQSMGDSVGILGTVQYRWPGSSIAAPLTTPGCLEVHSMLAAMQKDGVNKVFMEVSSHAIDQKRVAGISFSGALFTNLTQDHLDYHADMEDYFAAKAQLFLPQGKGGIAGEDAPGAVNADDVWGRKLLASRTSLVGFGLDTPSLVGNRYLKGKVLSMSPQGMRLAMKYEGRKWELTSALVGEFNAMNLLGVQALGLALGLPEECFTALESFSGVPGRLERIPNTHGINAFVDYAHTPDALIKAQTALHQAGFKRLVTLFGCGGNRDKTKRPLMGEAVAKLSDIAVLTSDNPRHEDPESIMDDVMPGLSGCKKVHRQADRRKALAEALGYLGPEDALLVAGKGHETYQQIGDEKRPFSDQAILRELMA